MALDFTIVGAQRSGTTWVFSKLALHPRIYFPLGKEPNFWNDITNYKRYNPAMTNYYHARFSHPILTNDSGFKRGDISVVYAVMDEESIRQLYATYPQVQSFYILRNPVFRSFSGMRLSVARGRKPADILSNRETLVAALCRDILPQSNYVENIIRWNRAANASGRKQPVILLYSDLVENPIKFIKNLANLIEIDASYYEKVPENILTEQLNSGVVRDLPRDVCERAMQVHRPMIERLEELVGRDLSGWLDVDNPVP